MTTPLPDALRHALELTDLAVRPGSEAELIGIVQPALDDPEPRRDPDHPDLVGPGGGPISGPHAARIYMVAQALRTVTEFQPGLVAQRGALSPEPEPAAPARRSGQEPELNDWQSDADAFRSANRNPALAPKLLEEAKAGKTNISRLMAAAARGEITKADAEAVMAIEFARMSAPPPVAPLTPLNRHRKPHAMNLLKGNVKTRNF